MERVNIKGINLKFLNPMTDRFSTDMIVIHHTGNENCVDTDPSAEEINRWHKNQGYAGIGYHFVIRKNGTIERGRPVWALGAHAYGENWHSIGIHFSGTFNGSEFSSLSELEKISEILVYFAYPYSSWEKGTVENLNGLFRRIYFKSSFLGKLFDTKNLIIHYSKWNAFCRNLIQPCWNNIFSRYSTYSCNSQEKFFKTNFDFN